MRVMLILLSVMREYCLRGDNMKQPTFKLSILSIVFFLFIQIAYSQNINKIENFPDTNFRACVERYMGVDSDGEYTAAEAAVMTNDFDCHGQVIRDLTGIEYFKNIQSLYCANNQLTVLDVKSNTALRILWCFDNQLSVLDLSSNTDLQELHCYDNQLTMLDVSSSIYFDELFCYENQLTELDLPNNMYVFELDCHNNQIQDISSLLSLIDLSSANIINNNLDYGDWEDVQSLIDILGYPVFYNNNKNILVSGLAFSPQHNYDPYDFTNINTIENFPDPNFRAYVEEYMGVDTGAEFTAVEAAAKTNEFFDCSNKKINDLSGIGYFKNLEILNCSFNPLTVLDISSNTALKQLYCLANQLTDLELSSNAALTALMCSDNSLTVLDLSFNTALTHLDCSNNKLTVFDASPNPALTHLDCRNNQLTVIDASSNAGLESLICSLNHLTALDVSSNTFLINLSCNNNQLTELDISGNLVMSGLYCSNNYLTELNLSSNTVLKRLYCSNNQLTDLDLQSNTALQKLRCFDNQIQDISNWVSLNNLTSVNVINNNLDYGDWPDVQLLVESLGEPVFSDDILQSGFAYSPQNNYDPYELNTSVKHWVLHE